MPSLRGCELTVSHLARIGGVDASAKVDGLREVQRMDGSENNEEFLSKKIKLEALI